MNPYIIVNGQSSLPDKISSVNQLSNATARQQWKTVFTKNPNIVSRLDTLVILNNRSASITFSFNLSAGNYDMYLRCIAPSSNTDTSIIRLDSTKPKILDLKRRPKQYISQQVNVLLFSNISLSNGAHTLTVAYKEPIGLIRLTVRKKRSSLQIVIPAVDMLYKPEQAPIIQPAPVVAYEATTQGPIIEAEYKPVEITTTSATPYVMTATTSSETPMIPPFEITSTSGPFYETTEGPQVIVPPYETTTTLTGAPIIIPPSEAATLTSAPPSSLVSSTSQPVIAPFVKQVSKKKKKGLPWWAILLIVLAVLSAIYLFYRWSRRGAVSYEDSSDQQILLDFTDKGYLLQWINRKLQDTTLQFSKRKELQSLKAALQSKSRSPEQQAFIKRMMNCRHPEEVLLKWSQRRSTDPNLSQAEKKQMTGLVQALKKQPSGRTPQQQQLIKRMLDCKDLNKQKQQQLLIFAQKRMADQSVSPAQKNQYNALIQALRKLPKQRSQQQQKLVSFALDCKQQGKPIVQVPSSIRAQQQKTRDLAQAGATAGPVPQDVPLMDFSFLHTRFKPDQQKQLPQIVSTAKTEVQNSLVNKLLKIDQKYNLKLIEPIVGQDDLGNQVFDVVGKDNVIKQYLQKFDPTSKQSQQQFPDIKKKLYQLMPDKRNNILIEKILQQSLNKQKQRQTSTLQSAASMFAGAQKKAAQQQAQKRQTQALQGAASMFAGAQKELLSNKKRESPGQFQRLIKVAKTPQGQLMTNIRGNIKKAS